MSAFDKAVSVLMNALCVLQVMLALIVGDMPLWIAIAGWIMLGMAHVAFLLMMRSSAVGE